MVAWQKGDSHKKKDCANHKKNISNQDPQDKISDETKGPAQKDKATTNVLIPIALPS